MKIRGHRECKQCGTRWYYYDTASISCPDCGSVRSVGIDDRTRHTNAPADYDLTSVRAVVDEEPIRRLAEQAAERSAKYVRKRGFIDSGGLLHLDETFVAATVLRHVGAELARELQTDDPEELFFLELLEGADDGDRPDAESVPANLRSAFGIAMTSTIDAYQRDVRAYLDDNPDRDARTLSGRIRDHRKRIEALDGNVSPRDAGRLLRATRDLGKYLADENESALVTADNWLSGIEE